MRKKDLLKMLNQVIVHNFFSSIVAVLSLVISSCQPINQDSKVLEQDKPKIVATHSVLCEFITIIAQNTVDLTCLVKPGQDPHTYKPTPSQYLQAYSFPTQSHGTGTNNFLWWL